MQTRVQPKQNRSESTVNDIFHAAVRHYRRVGRDRFTIAPVADAVGVSPATVFRYFSRVSLIAAVEQELEKRMTTYQKIPGPFVRDHTTNQLTEEFSSINLYALQNVPWLWTEKVDGTNVRVIWDGYRVTFGGRSDNAQLPMPLYTWLNDKFGGPEKEQLFEQKFGATPAVLYGEGYGPKIQSGGRYRDDISTVFYDVKVGDWWLLRDGIEDVCSYFGVDVVPVLDRDTLANMIAKMRAHKGRFPSTWKNGAHPMEGMVGVTVTGLLGRDGERIMVKLKERDFR